MPTAFLVYLSPFLYSNPNDALSSVNFLWFQLPADVAVYLSDANSLSFLLRIPSTRTCITPPLPTEDFDCSITEAGEELEVEETETATTQDPELGFSSTWEVLLGPFKVSFTIHPLTLSASSPFFVAALKRQWNPDRKAIELPEDDPRVFNEYLNWLYSRVSGEVPTGKASVFALLTEAYVLSDKYGDIVTANLIMDEILRQSDALALVPTKLVIEIIYRTTPETSPLRRFIVDCYVQPAARDVFEDTLTESLPPAFLSEVVHSVYTIAYDIGLDELTRRFSDGDKCHYHMHNETHPPCD